MNIKNKLTSVLRVFRKDGPYVKEINRVIEKAVAEDTKASIEPQVKAIVEDLLEKTTMQPETVKAVASNAPTLRQELRANQKKELQASLNPVPRFDTTEAAATQLSTGTNTMQALKPTVNPLSDLGTVLPCYRDTVTGAYRSDGKDEYPKLKGGYRITQPDTLEEYFLYFTQGKTWVLPAIDGAAAPMRILYRQGNGIVGPSEFDSLLKAKLTLTKLQTYYEFVEASNHARLDVGENVPWTFIGAVFISPTYITATPFRLDTASATLVF